MDMGWIGDVQPSIPRPGGVPHTPTYRLATFANDAAGGEGRHLDVCFELHFFFWVKEVLLFQLPKYSPLGLERAQKGHRGGGQCPGGGLLCPSFPQAMMWSQNCGPKLRSSPDTVGTKGMLSPCPCPQASPHPVAIVP